jgi:hypothetical protein
MTPLENLIEKHEEACVYAGNWEATGVLREFAIELLEMAHPNGPTNDNEANEVLWAITKMQEELRSKRSIEP